MTHIRYIMDLKKITICISLLQKGASAVAEEDGEEDDEDIDFDEDDFEGILFPNSLTNSWFVEEE